jgi:peptidoglycan hydrolase-like protein with peptidoglycan-binding domain
MPRNLSQGCIGADVRNLQMILNLQRGDPRDPRIGEDGTFGPETNARVRAFQDFCGLTVDGVVGPDTGAMLLPERTYTAQAALVLDDGGGVAFSSAPGAPRSLFGMAPGVVRAGVGDPPPGPNPSPAPAPNQRFAQFQVLAGNQAAFNPKLFSPLVVTAQYNLIIRNPGKTDFTLTTGGQFALNSGGTKGPGGTWTGQGFAQMGLAFNRKVIGFDFLNPFVVTMLQRNQGQPFTWGVGIGNQVNYALDRAGRLAFFINAQAVMNVDLTNGLASAPGLQILGGISYTFGQMPP